VAVSASGKWTKLDVQVEERVVWEWAVREQAQVRTGKARPALRRRGSIRRGQTESEMSDRRSRHLGRSSPRSPHASARSALEYPLRLVSISRRSR
jgi:hypothetical protein